MIMVHVQNVDNLTLVGMKRVGVKFAMPDILLAILKTEPVVILRLMNLFKNISFKLLIIVKYWNEFLMKSLLILSI